MKITTERFFLDIEEKNLLGAWTVKVSADMAKILDDTYKLYIQDKPKWLPEFIWRRVMRRLLKTVIIK